MLQPLTRDNRGCPITICSDSRAALMALHISNYSKEVLHCLDILTARNNTVTLIWIPEHVEIRGNEKADRLAGESDSVFGRRSTE